MVLGAISVLPVPTSNPLGQVGRGVSTASTGFAPDAVMKLIDVREPGAFETYERAIEEHGPEHFSAHGRGQVTGGRSRHIRSVRRFGDLLGQKP